MSLVLVFTSDFCSVLFLWTRTQIFWLLRTYSFTGCLKKKSFCKQPLRYTHFLTLSNRFIAAYEPKVSLYLFLIVFCKTISLVFFFSARFSLILTPRFAYLLHKHFDSFSFLPKGLGLEEVKFQTIVGRLLLYIQRKFSRERVKFLMKRMKSYFF